MLLRIWIWLTQSPGWSYARTMATGGIAIVVLGVALLAFGHRGNAGLPLVGVGIFTFAVGVVSALLRRP
jgi:hypothetical protein